MNLKLKLNDGEENIIEYSIDDLSIILKNSDIKEIYLENTILKNVILSNTHHFIIGKDKTTSYNIIKNIKCNEQLRHLVCDNCFVENIDINKNLNILECYYNNIKHLDLKNYYISKVVLDKKVKLTNYNNVKEIIMI